MDDISDEFVNRTREINNFKGLINDRRHRLLLIYGLEGRGKTYLRHQLLRISREEQMVSAVVDLQRARMLTEPDKVITHLSERLGSSFAALMMQAEEEIRRQPALDSAELGEALSRAFSANPQGPGSSVSLSDIERVHVGGSIVGGNQYILKNVNVFLNPDSGKKQDQAANEKRQNAVFRIALKHFLADQKRVILFFDHFEEATTLVSGWVSDYFLNLILEETGEFSNLWVIVVGRKVPLQDEIDNWRHILWSQQLDSLPDEAIYLVWIDRRGLDKDTVDKFIKGAKGNTKLLFLFLHNYAGRTETEQGDGQ